MACKQIEKNFIALFSIDGNKYVLSINSLMTQYIIGNSVSEIPLLSC